MRNDVVAILSLTAAHRLDRATDEHRLEWTVPCAYAGVPVAFVAQGRAAEGGQEIRALGRVVNASRRRWRNRRCWHCADVTWLKRPLRQRDLTDHDREALGKLGGFANYRLQGTGAGIRSEATWHRLLQAISRLNPKLRVRDYAR